jgi:hypothetical protein
MSRYARLRIAFEDSEYVDFARSESIPLNSSKTVTSVRKVMQAQILAAGTDIVLGEEFGTNVSMILFNRSAAQTISAAGTRVTGSAAFTELCPVSAVVITHDIKPTSTITLTSSSGTIEADIIFFGA